MRNVFDIAAVACVVCWLFVPAGCSCDDEQSEEDIARALANRLTESLGFKGGTVVEGPPPEEHRDDMDYAQVTKIQAPGALAAGQEYTVSLDTDFSNPRDVTGAVVYVEKADRHLKVKPLFGLDPEAMVMRLVGTFEGDPELVGKSFSVKIAMHDAETAVGNYVAWELAVRDAADVAPTTQELANAMEVSDLSLRTPGNIPRGTADPSEPQVLSIETPDRVGPGRAFEVTVRYRVGAAPLFMLYFQVDNSIQYVGVGVDGEPGTEGVAVLTVSFSPSKLSNNTGGLSRALNALSSASSAPNTSTIAFNVGFDDAAQKHGTLKTKSLTYTTEERACEGKGCATAKECRCGDPGVTLDPRCEGPDATECSGLASVYCGQDPQGDCERDFDSHLFPDGYVAMGTGCSIQINCGLGGGRDGGSNSDAAAPRDTGDADAGREKDGGAGDAGAPDSGALDCFSCEPPSTPFTPSPQGYAFVAVQLSPPGCTLYGEEGDGAEAVMFEFFIPNRFQASVGPGWTIESASEGVVAPDKTSWENIPSETWLEMTLRNDVARVEISLGIRLSVLGLDATLEVQEACSAPSP
ncbi:MAG: hypothetical protein HY897_20745 [Deltaproteobacteria bacterium]|nr:hypothetical protein [Deltaproteobacteria bacterium]